MRKVLNALFYVLKTGCQWAMLPHDLPPKGTVCHYFNNWRKQGLWEQMRQQLGRESTPSADIMDSQSVKATETGA